MIADYFFQGDHEVYSSQDRRWFITRSYKTGSFRLHDTLHNSQTFIGNMPDLRVVSELAALVYQEAHERFKNDLITLADKSDIMVFVPDEDIPF